MSVKEKGRKTPKQQHKSAREKMQYNVKLLKESFSSVIEVSDSD